ncbi:MAG: pyridoxal phosphate-dependent aminotransferase [Lentisphaeria bacterium]
MVDQPQISVSPTLGSLQPSATLTISSQAKAMIKEGIDVTSLCAGEPDFDTPEHVKKAAVKALEAGDTKYTPVPGRPELREAIAQKVSAENDIQCEAGQVIVAPGAKFSVFSTIVTLCSASDEVILPKPYWVSYPEMVRAAGATAVPVETSPEDGFCMTPENLRAAITSRTKLLVLNTPSNPCGGMYSRSQLEAIAALAVEHNFVVLADEIYEKLIYDSDHEHVSIASLNDEIRERTVTVNGFSKAYSMTGWRLGYLVAPEWLVKRISALQSHTTSNPTSFAQMGALAALQGSQEPVDEMREAFRQRRDMIFALLQDIPGIKVEPPHGAFYIFPDISSFGLDSMTFAKRILEEAKVGVIPGAPFGMDAHVRLSYACDNETIEKACARIKEFCATLG